jgi:hypothetical protein
MKHILTEEQLGDIWKSHKEIKGDKNLLFKDAKDIELLSFKKIKGLLDTFPPVWNPRLVGFKIYQFSEIKISMMVSFDSGLVEYQLGTIKCSDLFK